MAAIELIRVTKAWGATVAVRDISFEVEEGSFVVLLGPSGCGKSTTLRMIAGLDDVTSGRVLIGGQEMTGAPPAERRVSMVFQSYALFPHLDAGENILFGLKARKVAKADQTERLARVAEMVGLADLLDRKPAQLSEGSASGSRWRGRSSPRTPSASWTSRCRTSTPSCGTRCGSRSGRSSNASA